MDAVAMARRSDALTGTRSSMSYSPDTMHDMTHIASFSDDGPGARAQAALREEMWRDIELRWGLHDDSEGVIQQARSSGSEPTGVEREGQVVYPGFQLIDRPDVGAVLAPAWVALCQRLTTRWSREDAILWTCSVNAYLQGGTPAEEIQSSPDAMSPGLVRAAEEAFAPPPCF
jgi:hypothetical protein